MAKKKRTKSKKPKPPKRKRKLTAAEKRARRERREKYMTIFVNGKQKRVPRPQLIDGLTVDEFIERNADPIWLHQEGLWELIPMDGAPASHLMDPHDPDNFPWELSPVDDLLASQMMEPDEPDRFPWELFPVDDQAPPGYEDPTPWYDEVPPE